MYANCGINAKEIIHQLDIQMKFSIVFNINVHVMYNYLNGDWKCKLNAKTGIEKNQT